MGDEMVGTVARPVGREPIRTIWSHSLAPFKPVLKLNTQNTFFRRAVRSGELPAVRSAMFDREADTLHIESASGPVVHISGFRPRQEFVVYDSSGHLNPERRQDFLNIARKLTFHMNTPNLKPAYGGVYAKIEAAQLAGARLEAALPQGRRQPSPGKPGRPV